MNLTKTLIPFVRLSFIFQLRHLKLPDFAKNIEKWTDLTWYFSVALNAEIRVIHT